MKKLSLITPSHSTGDACMDAGGRATQEAKAEGWGGGEKCQFMQKQKISVAIFL